MRNGGRFILGLEVEEGQAGGIWLYSTFGRESARSLILLSVYSDT